MSTLVPVVFRFPGTLAPAARRVALTATFNNWNPTAHPLTKTGDGGWSTVVFLPPGRVVYVFWVDGTIWLDPEDDGREANAWGSEYSIRHVRIDAEPSLTRSA
jgi:1,4-alpha-glucan branching enzyme